MLAAGQSPGRGLGAAWNPVEKVVCTEGVSLWTLVREASREALFLTVALRRSRTS